MLRIFALIAVICAATIVVASPIVVNCDQGQSLNRTLSMLNKDVPATVVVKGTCTEYVRLSGFEGLTLKGLPGANLRQPSTDTGTGLDIFVLSIEASRRVTVDGIDVHSRSSATAGIGIGRGSSDVRLRNLTVDGSGMFGVNVYETSEASLAKVTARDPGYCTVGVFGTSHVHIEDSLLENSTGAEWHTGLQVGPGDVNIHGTTIRNMTVGLFVTGGSVSINEDTSYYPLGGGVKDLTIENPAGSNWFGVWILNGGLVNVGNANLRITKAGQSWGYFTGAVSVSGGSTLKADNNLGGNLVVSGSQGQGVFVSDNSHASLNGASITGSGHGGLVALNLSTIAVAGDVGNVISGNAVDLFCDSKSLISGRTNVAYASAQCANLLDGSFEAVP